MQNQASSRISKLSKPDRPLLDPVNVAARIEDLH